MTMGPCHLYFVVADGAGNQSHSCKVDIVYAGTLTPVTEPLFFDEAMLTPAGSANLTVPGVISLWTASPIRVDLHIRSFDVGNQNIFGLDFLNPPENTIHGGRNSVGASTSEPGDVLVTDGAGAAAFQPVDIVNGHFHSGRDPLVVAAFSMGTSPLDPYTRISYDANSSLRTLVAPAHGPGSTLIGAVSNPGLISDTYWPIPGSGGSATDPLGDDTQKRDYYDPAGLGDSLVVGVDMTVIGGRHTAIGHQVFARTDFLDSTTPPASVLGEGVAVGHSATSAPAGVVLGSHPNFGSYPNHGVVAGFQASYYIADTAQKMVFLGPYAFIGDSLYSSSKNVVGDTVVGSLNAGQAQWGYDLPWGITTILMANDGLLGGTVDSPLSPSTPMQPSNDSWLYTERYATWRRLGLTVDQAHAAAADITRNTVIPRKVDAAPVGDNFEATTWTGWNITAQNLYSRLQPISDTADYENGLVLITVPDPTVPGDLLVDGGVTLGAPLHDGVGGGPGALGFFGTTPAARSLVARDPSIPALASLHDALASLGLVLSAQVPVVADPMNRETYTLDHADTGQAPVGFQFYTGNIGSSGGVATRISTTGTGSGYWVPVLYYTDLFDVYAQITVDTFHGTDDGLLIRAVPTGTDFVANSGRSFDYAIRAGRDALYLRTASGETTLATYSTAAVDGDTLRIEAVARAITVKVNGSTVATHTMPDDSGGYMHGLAMNDTTTMHDLSIGHP